MADALVGKASVTYIFVVPTREGAEAARIFFEGDADFWESRVINMGL